MTSRLDLLKLFVPLAFITIPFSGELKANANETTKPLTSNGAALLGQPSIDVQQFAEAQNNPVASSPAVQRNLYAQTTPSTPSEIAPARSVPGSAPSSTPTNPADVTPSDTTPVTPQNPTPSIPQNTTPSTPSTTPEAIPGTVPGTTPTTPDSTTPGTTSPDTTPTTPLTIPTEELSPGRATRSGSSYFGVGGNIGLGDGDISLGETSFALLSKIGLTRNFSVRPSVLFSDDVAILVPITYDFSFGAGPTEGLGFSAAPFLGVGAAISTGEGGEVGLLLTGGVDVPLSSQFTATASVNASVTGQSAVGILFGVGYNFAGF